MEREDKPSLAAVLKDFRSRAGLTQEELAERANLSAQAISHLERGINTRPWPDTIERLVKALQLAQEDAEAFCATARGWVRPRVIKDEVDGTPSLPPIALTSTRTVSKVGLPPAPMSTLDGGRHTQGVIESPIIPAGRTEPAQQAREKFEREVANILNAAEAIPLSIFLWSPASQSDGPVARKREQVRRVLEEHGDFVPASDGSLGHLTDIVAAMAADQTIMLVEGEAECILEAIQFCEQSQIHSKVFVMAPATHRHIMLDDLRDLIARHDCVDWYDDRDISECYALSRIMDRCLARRLSQLLVGGERQ